MPILLDEVDKELEARNLRFCRYADDLNIYVESKRAGERVKKSVTQYLEKKLKLIVNEEKSAVDRPWKRKFLGFSFTSNKETKVRIAPKSLKRVKDKIREITNPSKPYRIEDRIELLNRYLLGWMGYYALIDTTSKLKELDAWIRRRLRLCLWNQWKRVRTRIRELRNLGLEEHRVLEISNTRNSLTTRYLKLREDWRTAVY